MQQIHKFSPNTRRSATIRQVGKSAYLVILHLNHTPVDSKLCISKSEAHAQAAEWVYNYKRCQPTKPKHILAVLKHKFQGMVTYILGGKNE